MEPSRELSNRGSPDADGDYQEEDGGDAGAPAAPGGEEDSGLGRADRGPGRASAAPPSDNSSCGPLRGVPRLFPKRRPPGKRTRIRAPGPRLLTTLHFSVVDRVGKIADVVDGGVPGRGSQRVGVLLNGEMDDAVVGKTE